jgi:RHS repeat-associated protein
MVTAGPQYYVQAAAGHGARPVVQPDHRIPSVPFVASDRRAAAVKGSVPHPGPLQNADWPAPASADVALGPSTRSASAGAAAVAGSAASLPLTLRAAAADSAAPASGLAASAAPAGSTVHVQLLDHAAAAKAGVAGVLFTLTPGTAAAAGPVEATVDYSAFRDAGGAGFGDRLRLVRLPACALTTPNLAACQVQTPLTGTGNDAAHHTVTARVDLSQAGQVSPAASSQAATSSRTTASAMVLAATAGSSGSGGDFTVSSPSPTGTWSAGGPTGGFSWSYPITVPPAAAGSAPQVWLNYDSNVVDGRTAETNNQPSWVGEGWDYDPGHVERVYRPCSAFTDLPTSSQTADQCWSGQVLMLSLHGKSIPLVYDDAKHTLHEQTDAGDQVEMLTGSSNGALNGEYFKVTTPDGTQYYFGRDGGPGAGATNSTWTVPVYGAHAGDPCYSSSGFSASSCTQGWRWNLDYVEDVHGNATMYYYTPETSYYGQNNSTTGTSYVRGGYLTRIDYGLRDENGTVYGSAAPDQVVFNVAERCTPTSTFTCDPSQMSANPAKWPDVPVDQQCTAGATCNVHAPTFWSTKRLTTITTQYANSSGGYTKVDSYALGQSFPTDADAELWLSGITRTGYDSTGASLSLLPTTFYGQAMVNRVPNYNSLPGMPHWRLTSVSTDTGSVVAVTYSTSCSTSTIPSDPAQNTSQCMPAYWTPQLYSAPILDYFNKYVVTEVDKQDPSALTPMLKTMYSYVGGAAWHYDDNEVVKPANRTWGQFRGYGEVDVKTGNTSNGEQLTDQATTYFRGMNGDTLANGATRNVQVADSLGESVADDEALAGQQFEQTTSNGDGGARLSRTISDPAVVATTATRARTGLPALTATMVRPVKTRTLTDLAAGGVRTVTATDGYDPAGRVVSLDESGDGVPEVCSTTSYAENLTTWVRDRQAEVIRSKQTCPPAGTAPSNVMADTRTYYDGSAALGTLPGAGDPTRIDKLDNGTFFTNTTSTYDSSGRVLTLADALGRSTSTAYTPSDGGVLTQQTVTNPLAQTVTSVFNPDRGTKASYTDVAGHVESATYDPLGRVTQVWKPGRTQGQVTPNTTYTYLVQAAGPDVITENDLVDYGTGTNYVTSTKLYDTMGRLVQTQTAAENGGSQVSDTFYDGHGWTAATNDHYLIAAAPGSTVQQVAANAVDERTVNKMDGSGRTTLSTSYRDGVATRTTQTVYGGDRVTVFPPQGGTVQTSVFDTRGQTTELDQYTSAPGVNGSVVSGGAPQATVYGYDALGRMTSLQSAGSTWNYTMDTLGRVVTQQSPDSGTTKNTFDNAGQVTSTTDARGQTVAFTYDAGGRKTAEYSGSTTGTKLASWLYDTLQTGRLSTEIRYTPSGNYVTGTTGYDGQGNAISQLTVIPSAETGLAGRYTTTFGYSSTGLLLTTTPAPIAGMPGETVTTTYDKLGNPVGVNGTSVTASQALSGYGLPSQITYGGSTNNAWLSYTYDPQTLKATDANLSAQIATPQLDDTQYSYDPFGHVTSVADTQGPNGSPVDDQCYVYDALGRLGQAWTSGASDCTHNPATLGSSAVGGPNPYWSSWTFDSAGDRLSQTTHATAGGPATDQTTTYSYNTGSGGHSLAGTTGGPGGPTGYTYDASGNTLTRNLPGGSQSFAWNADGKPSLATTPAGSTTWIYTADNTELVRRDPGSTTVYLPAQEVTRSSNGTVTTKRYYTLGTQSVAVSDGTTPGTEYLVGDQHGTQQLAVNTTSLALTRRSTDPYGNLRGTVAGGAWPDNHGFLNMPLSSGTGLVDVGAREYDPAIGKFISVDPVVSQKDPQALTGYAYADNAPTTSSDPSGLMRDGGDGGGYAPIPSDGGGSGGCGCDDWFNDPSQNTPQPTIVWSDPSPSSSSTPDYPSDRWWDDPAPDQSAHHYCDGCAPLPKAPPKGLEKAVPSDGNDVVYTATQLDGTNADYIDMTTAQGYTKSTVDDPQNTYQESTSITDTDTHSFTNSFGWTAQVKFTVTASESAAPLGIGAKGEESLEASVGANGQYQWSDSKGSSSSDTQTYIKHFPVKAGEVYGRSPFGVVDYYTTAYVHRDGSVTYKDWASFNITSWVMVQYDPNNHPTNFVK